MNHTTSSSLVSHHNSIPSNEWALQREWSPACNRHQDPVQWPIVEPSPRERKQILLWLRIVLLMILILRCNIYRLRNKHETQNKQIKTYPGKKSLSKLYKCPSHRKAFLSGKRSSFASTWRSGGEFVRWRVCQVDAAKKGRQKKHPDELGSTVVPNNWLNGLPANSANPTKSNQFWSSII